MRTALVTTTINVPHVLKLYRKLGPNVKFFVALDQKSPFNELSKWGNDDHFSWLTPDFQKQWKCSELIGWNCIQRRNIAILEALKWGAGIIVTVDDDNATIRPDYFDYFSHLFETNVEDESFELCCPWTGPKVSGLSGWFDVGQMLAPVSPHRGFPHNIDPHYRVDFAVDAKVGVAAGICLGDPDISAITRIANHPEVHNVSELLRPGIVVDNQTWTVFNSQNTAFIRELAPCMFLFPGVGRYDDIYASLFTQRIMRELGYHVHFGQPFVWQQRNEHNLIKDLRNEIDGMENVQKLAKYLDSVPLGLTGSVVQMYYTLVEALVGNKHLSSLDILPKSSIEAALAWCSDVEQVIK